MISLRWFLEEVAQTRATGNMPVDAGLRYKHYRLQRGQGIDTGLVS